MKRQAILFEIENNQEEYVRCLHIMELIEKKQISDDGAASWNTVKLISYEEQWQFKDIMEQASVPLQKEWNKIEIEYPIEYIFNVKCTDENDIIDLLYYCLLYDRISQKGHNSTLCVECSAKQGANISDFLTWILSAGTIKNCYIHINKIYRQISSDRIKEFCRDAQNNKVKKPRNGVRIMRQFSPIFRIDKAANEGNCESVIYWRQPMRTFLKKIYKKMEEHHEKSLAEDDTFLPQICPTNLRAKYPEEIWQGVSCANEKHLLSNFVECFCTAKSDVLKNNETKSIDFSEKRYELWKSRKLFDHIKEIPLLAMYIFCISDYFLRDMSDDCWEKIEQEIFDARDMADGVLQILENIYHSEMGRGYFCFRVHTDSEGRSKQYLRNEYNAYMKEWEEQENAPQDYLEIKVVDFSRRSIPIQFASDFRKRMAEASEEEMGIYQNIQQKADELKVSSFFGDSSDFWDEYNKISENLVHHYGLQIFESLVSCYGGYFRIRSQSTEKLQRERELYVTHETSGISDRAIPGTQYDILIPFRKQIQMQNLSLNININYTEGLLKGYNDNVCKDIELVQESCDNILQAIKEEYPEISYQERKERAVQALSERLQYLINEKNADKRIIHFSARKIPLSRIELFCKAVMLNIAEKPEEQSFYAMITECTTDHFVEITRMLTLFYNKQGVNPHMKNVQIFMSGEKEGEEFLITGVNLGEAIGSTEKLAFARCTNPDCLKIMKKMLKNHRVGVNPNEMVSIVPFDMIQYDDSKETLLERRLVDVLNQDVQSEQFGCKLEGLHVRIGSKIHIETFYEAELLFHNNYYTSRFAFWLYNELSNNDELDLSRPFVLIGCENYSEMLLNETCNMFRQTGIETEYLIYEERIAGKFRGKKSLDSYKDYQFVIVVPINSTLTTHIKISGFLEKAIQGVLKRNKVSDYNQYRLGMVLNYGVVLIDTEGENDYWHKAETEKNVLISKINNNTMKYYIEVPSKWANPLECKACFPDDDYTKEIPLVETNKESIVPMHAIGMKKHGRVQIEADGIADEQIHDLTKFLVYRHVERNGNHFNYYFATERLWDYQEIRNKIHNWLSEKKSELFMAEQYKVYDIIVAPLHYSNSVFVEEVNECLFKNAALVLHFDADKEFRMNVRTKYSSIQQLYDNLCEGDEKSAINFHYVDDTIVSGRTYRRMKSLIASVIREKEKRNVQINIFKSIVLLLNRMSQSSIRDYIDDQRYFLAYFNLRISSMRVNSDACVLCKKYNEWNKLAQQASLNSVFAYWQKKSEDLKCIPVEQIELEKDMKENQVKRYGQYMLASHRAKTLLDAVCDYTNTKEELQALMVDRLLPEDVSDSLDELAAMLKVLGRPFLSFRREEKEAVFGLMLTMLDTLLEERIPQGEEKINVLLRQIWANDEHRIIIVKMLLNRLAELESNYMIRKRSMSRILTFCFAHIADEQKRKEFIDNYLHRVKQLVGQSNDFAKGLFLEYLLLYDEEYRKNVENRAVVSISDSGEAAYFKKNAYLENTKLINYGIEYLAESFSANSEFTSESIINTLNKNYYFDNFIQYLVFHQVVETDERGEVLAFASDIEWKKIEGMIRFELLYQQIFGESNIIKQPEKVVQKEAIAEEDIKDKYKKMMECLRDASGALDGEIIVPYEDKEAGKKYIALELGTSTEIRELEKNEQEIKEFMNQNKAFEGNTYAICDRVTPNCGSQKWLLLKFFEKTEIRNDDISEIYLLFPFKTQDEDTIIHALKNILVFRHRIWKILNLSSSTLLKNWTDNLFYKQQVLKSRAVRHSEVEDIHRKFKKFSRQICEEFQGNEQPEKVYKEHFELLVNNMIGAMNVKLLGNMGKTYAETTGHTLKQYWGTMGYVKNAMSKVWGLDICIEDSGLEQYQIRLGTEGEAAHPLHMLLDILFMAVFQNIKHHGYLNENQRREAFISVKEDKLWISNRVEEEEKVRIEEMLRPENYRIGEGISLAVIYDICKSWYFDTKYSDMFEVCERGEAKGCENGKNDSKTWMYVVKLPIIERRGENE